MATRKRAPAKRAPARRSTVKLFPPTSTSFKPRKNLKPLPPLPWRASPNESARTSDRPKPYLVVMHRPVGEYHGTVDWLCNPRSQASAHAVTEGHGTGVDVATQLVAWQRKAWTCASFNSVSYNIEADDDAWDGDDWGAFYTAAHIAGFICHKTGIPPTWSKRPSHTPGVIRHLDLGQAGGGHTDPTQNLTVWRNFIRQVAYDLEHTGWRKTWGKGTFKRL